MTRPVSITRALFMLTLTVALVTTGCNVDGRYTGTNAPRGAASPTQPSQRRAQGGVDVAIVPSGEVDLVEAVALHRDAYHRHLARLHDFYLTSGDATKQAWASFELAGLRDVKKFRYLMDAEIPSESLRAADTITEADTLYEEARRMMRAGGHGVPLIYRQDRMIEAAALFRDLIERFPGSDKIDDAAFYLGEIHKDYLPGQETLAVKWYERAWTWNPDTPHPARFQAALVYDYRLHERARALELYRAVVNDDRSNRSDARFAARRIEQLTGEGRTADAR